MTKRQLIDEIRRLNPTAAEPFLERFDEPTLRQYLKRLEPDQPANASGNGPESTKRHRTVGQRLRRAG